MLTTDWNSVHNIVFLSITAVGNPKLHIAEIIIQNNWYAKFPFKKLKSFLVWQCIRLALFFPLNEFSASQKCWIDRLLERAFVYPSNEDSMGSSRRSSHF